MPVVIGTAGHIDHGKTALVRALTGQETDRLKEEQARGISIDLGFAHLALADGTHAGVVDVPGHERFIRNMLAGAHGVDLVLFAVAADDGVMPQTEEHLDILHLLGVRCGIFVVTKTDLVDAARVATVREEIEILTLDTTLEGSPIVPVSTVTGEGLDALRQEIARRLACAVPPRRTGAFRLPVDRAFVLHGHGTVVTGTASRGRVREDDVVRLLPGGATARVRSLEVHGAAVPEAGAGQRVAVNLAGIERADVRRGHVVCDPRLARTTDRFDAYVELRPGARRSLASHARLRVHAGTAEVEGKIILLDGRGRLGPRDHGWAQLVLAGPLVALRGDRFVLRDETARWTLGGGVVVSPFAVRHRRDEPGLVGRLEALRSDDLATAASAFLDLVADFASDPATVALALDVAEEDLVRALRDAPAVAGIPDARAPEAHASAARLERVTSCLVGLVEAAHRAAPLEPGVEMEHVRSALGEDVSAKVFRWLVDGLVARGLLVRDESLLRLPTHTVALGGATRALADRLDALLAAGGFTPPDLRQLEETTGAPRRELVDVLAVLEKEGRLARVAPDLYYARPALDEARERLAAHCRAHGDISAAVFRDLIGASRKFAIALLDWCDRTGLTTRVGDLRRLRR